MSCHGICLNFLIHEVLVFFLTDCTYLMSKLAVLGFSVETKLVLWFPVWNLVNLEPLDGGLHEPWHVLLHIVYVT